VLGVSLGATPDEIRRAFRVLALATHPDRGGEASAFIEAKRAHDVALAAARSPTRRRRRR
jgi:curved DNA-binding protein CbpA